MVPGMSRPLPDRPASGLRVVTLNVWGRFGDWDSRRSLLVEGLAALDADLVALVECVKTDDYDQALDLLGDGYQILYQRDYEDDGRRVAIASRWPVERTQEVDLHLTPRTGSFPCVTLIAEITATEPIGPLLFVATNPSYERDYEVERERQAVASARAVERLAADWVPRHVVLAGDFDAGPDAASMRFWCGRQSLDGMSVSYRDAWEAVHPDESGHTFTPLNPLVPSMTNPMVVDGETPLVLGERIDHIMLRGGHHGYLMHVAACERIFDAPVNGVWGSDHFGVVADFVPLSRP